MKFEKRVRALESEAFDDATTLHFADGGTRDITGQRYYLLNLFAGACGGDLNSDQAKQLKLILASEAAEEPGGGRMIEVMQALLQPGGESAD